MSGISEIVDRNLSASAADQLSCPLYVHEQVLLVDSDAPFCRSLCALLAHAGISARCFRNGGDLLRISFGAEVACLLVDVDLPDMNGVELLEQLNAAGRTVPAIILASASDVPTAVRAMRAKAADFIEKPCVEGLLVKRIRQIVQRHPG